MNERQYVLAITTTSSGAEVRTLTPYNNDEVALRKFYEPFGDIGAGPLKICVLLLDQYLNVIKREVWIKYIEPEEPEEPEQPEEPENPEEP